MPTGCRQVDTPLPAHQRQGDSDPDNGDNYPEEAMILGERLNNPYTVEVMAAAYNWVLEQTPDLCPATGSPVHHSHTYLRFVPEDSTQVDLVRFDSTLILYGYPLDHVVDRRGIYYVDEEAAQRGRPNPLYTSIEVGHEFLGHSGDVDREVIAELYIPEQDRVLQERIEAGAVSQAFEDSLISKAHQLTGNTYDLSPGSHAYARSGLWRPSGRITVWDNSLDQQVPVHGVEVRARRWFTSYRGLTDANGNFSCDGEFRRPANYSIEWDRRDFSIRSGESWIPFGNWGQAIFDGPKQEGDWNLSIGQGSIQQYYAHIFRAAHHYYYLGIEGLRRPPLFRNTFDTQLKINASHEANPEALGNHVGARRFLGLGAQIKIFHNALHAPQRGARDLYGTVIHELAHASHWEMGRSDFNQSEDPLAESWARGVQWRLTSSIYSGYQPQYWRIATHDPPFSHYTGVVQDLFDGDNFNHDQVCCYTMRQLEDALNGKRTISDWENQIRTTINNPTSGHVPRLFHHWFNR